MAKMGRPKKPTAKLKIHGTYRSDRRYDSEPKPDVYVPERPKWLVGDAKKEWYRITPILAKMKCISEADLAMLAAYCFEWGLYVALARKVKVENLTTVTDKGNEMLSPLLNARNRALKNFKEIATEFGLSPSSRTRVATNPSEEPDNPFVAMFNRKSNAG